MVFVRVVRVVQQGREGRGLQWGICHVAMFGSLPANKYGALSVSRADGRWGERMRKFATSSVTFGKRKWQHY